MFAKTVVLCKNIANIKIVIWSLFPGKLTYTLLVVCVRKSLTGSDTGILGPQLVALFGEV